MAGFVSIAVLFAGIVSLVGTRRNTPFLRWGIIFIMAGAVLISSAAYFAVRSLAMGGLLLAAGAGAYYFGRLVRKERLFSTQPPQLPR